MAFGDLEGPDPPLPELPARPQPVDPPAQPEPPPQILWRARSRNTKKALKVYREFGDRNRRVNIEKSDLGVMDKECHHCHALHWLCERRAGSGSTVANPQFTTCCREGQISLPVLQAAPPPLHQYLHNQTQMEKGFRNNIRHYNNAFAFTSFGTAAIDNTVNVGNGPWVFKINGEVVHRHGSLLPEDGQSPIYAQVYFYDSNDATAHRMSHPANHALDRSILQDLHDMFQAHNHFAQLYRHAVERLQQDQNIYSLTLRVDNHTDLRRYNLPSGNEGVAAIIPNIPNATSRDIVVHQRGGQGPFQRVSESSGAYDPLYYVLLFPRGELGWHWDLPRVNRGNNRQRPNEDEAEDNLEENALGGREEGATNTGITRMNYYSYRLHQRVGEAETVIRGGKLFQQWVVDAWATVEQARLNWIRFNQNTIRAEMYCGVQDAIDTDGDLGQIGQAMVLPATFTGSPRAMFQKCQDSMSIICHTGKEDLFITMTANPQWPEIQNALLPGQTASDRPELVSRVFHQKLKETIKDIWANGVFGRAIAHVHTIEFQKRGLPHAHILIWLAPEDKPHTEAAVDKIVCAEIPDPAQFPHLHAIITTSMLHGPCGVEDPNAICMKDGRCTKRFPKPFQEATSLTEDGYPTYRRRQTGLTYTKHIGRGREFVYTNQWVVPYNPYLTAKYNCHINVEICNGINAVKYIHKYIFKGHDRITLGIQQNDEIKKYLDSRYIGPHEAAWRLFSFSMHAVLPAVERLTVHLPNEQMVYFNLDDNAERVQGQMEQDTKLMGYFKYNRENPEDRRLLYADFPKYFVWHKRQRGTAAHWAPRQRGFAIGRMPWVSPRAGERYFLRYLLTAVAGSTSFEGLRTVNGHLHVTFQQACQALGMLEDDTECQAALTEAATIQTGSQLRSLFAIILLHCQPTSPGELWTQFRDQICDDLQRRIQRENAAPLQVNVEDPSQEHVWDFGLYLLDVILNANKTSLAQIPGMPTFTLQWINQLANCYIREQRAYNPDEQQALAREAENSMNAEQKTAYTAIIDSVINSQGKLFFLTGPGGTGKTFVYRAAANSIRGGDQIVLCVASSGIAALLLEGGTTAHSCFNIPLNLQEGGTCSITKTHAKAELIRQASAIIWDEAPMQHRYCMEAVDATCRDIRESDQPFGGLTVVFGGDFCQILPVIPKGSRQEIIAAALSRSTLWHRTQILPLTQNMRLDRTAEEAIFATWLLRVGEGKEQEGTEGMITLPPATKVVGGIIDLIKISYPNLDCFRQGPDWFTKRSILSTRNHDVDDINLRVLNMFPGQEHVMLSADKVVEDEHDVALTGGNGQLMYTPEFLQSVPIPGFPLAKLRLKVGVPVMVLRNLDPSSGICNGTRLLLTQIRPRILEGTIMGGKFSGKRVYIPRITFISNKDELPFILSRRQFPVRLAFSMTINKSQGQSLWFVGLDLRTPVFSHGQLYVALSRSTSVTRLKILFPPDSEDTKTTNVVWPEALINN